MASVYVSYLMVITLTYYDVTSSPRGHVPQTGLGNVQADALLLKLLGVDDIC